MTMRITKKNIFNQVLEYLRKEIILGNYLKGEYLVEVNLAKELNVSRGPVREAIAKLEAENLVEKHSNGRTVVKGFDVKDIQDLYDSRILLENHALTQISSDELKENENLLFRSEYLVEVNLAKELNVSRGPVREAIAKLEAENLVEKHSNGRTVVKGFDVKDIQDLYDSRILLENHALTQISSDELKENENLLF